MPLAPATKADAAGLRLDLAGRVLGAITLVYWVLLPTGLLLPVFIGFGGGVHAAHLGIGLMLLMATALLLRPPAEPAASMPVWHVALVVVFVAFLGISSIDPINSRELIFLNYAIFGLAILGGLSASLIARRIGPSIVEIFLAAFCCSLLVYGLFWLVYLDQMIARAKGDWVFVFWPFANIRTVGIYFMPAIVGAVIFAAMTPDRRRTVFYAIVGTLGMTFLFWTGSRGPLLAVFVAFGVVACLQPVSNRRRFVVTVLAVTVIASLLSLLLPRMSASYGFWQRILEMFGPDVPDPLTGRGSVWAYTLEKILARPWTGYGFGSYLSHPDAEVTWRRHAHNDILQMWHDFGLIGGTAGLGLMLAATWKAMAGRATTVGSLACVGMVVSLLSVAMVDTVIGYVQSFTFLCLVLGVLAGISRGAQRAEA